MPDPKIENDIGDLLEALAGLGFKLKEAKSSPSFNDFYVVMDCRGRRLRIVRDRGQYSLERNRRLLEPAGLWKAFDSKEEFREKVLPYARQRAGKAAE